MATLKAAARRHGATVDDAMIGHGRVVVESPAGMIWAGSSTHCLVLDWHDRGFGVDRDDKAAAIADALERMSGGVVPCDDPDCEYCNPPEAE